MAIDCSVTKWKVDNHAMTLFFTYKLHIEYVAKIPQEVDMTVTMTPYESWGRPNCTLWLGKKLEWVDGNADILSHPGP